MATYAEIAAITEDPEYGNFREKIAAAAAIKATAIINSATPSAEALEWARGAVVSPRSAGGDLVWYVIADNASAAISAIVGATDAAIQTAVDTAVDAIYP